jgi:hypothetical protein
MKRTVTLILPLSWTCQRLLTERKKIEVIEKHASRKVDKNLISIVHASWMAESEK